MGNYLGFFSSCTSFVHVAGGTKTTSKCCFWTTGEDHLMRRNGSDGEFSGRVTEASRRRSKKKPLRIYRILRIFTGAVHIGLCTFCVHSANPLTAYLPHYPFRLFVMTRLIFYCTKNDFSAKNTCFLNFTMIW